MGIKTILKKIFKSDGKNSQISFKIKALSKSKEFDYLVDVKKL